MAAPTFVAEYESVWNTTTTPKTISVTTAVDDVLALGIMVENGAGGVDAPTGGTGLTWTLRQSIDIDINWCTTVVYTAVATTAETFTLSSTITGSGAFWGFNCLRWSGSDGVGASAKANVSGAAPSLALTTTGANSAVATFNSDWNAADGASRTWRNGETEQTYFRDAARYTVYAGRWNDSGAAGAKTLGLSAPAGQKYSIAGVEILGSAGGAPAIPPHLVMATRR